MRRNFILDSVLLLCSLILLVTGGLLWGNTCRWSIPRRWAVDDPYHPARMVHRCASVAFLAGLLVHLIWHWKWIRDTTPMVLHGDEGE